MAARRPNALNAAIEVAFVAAAGLLGFLGAPLWALPALACAMIAYWIWNRRAGLAQLRAMGAGKLLASGAIALVLITAVLAGAFWLGATARG
ncbi:MAG: hypothetical protein AB7M12_12980 [Hyphomonadaceae bacterium]